MQYLPATATNDGVFFSVKTPAAIPARRALVRDALVQTSLDPAVRSIEFIPTARVATTPVDLEAIVIHRNDGRFYLDVVAARPLRDLDNEGLALIALEALGLGPLMRTTADIQREPRLSNSRVVWSHRLHPVGTSLRTRILKVLGADGPMALSRLRAAIGSEQDPTPAVMALACFGLIELDLVSVPIGPQTKLRAHEPRFQPSLVKSGG
jgi:hypothetical protein